MENITTTEELKNAIELLEFEQTNNWQLVKEELFEAFEGLKPLNLIKNTISEATSSPNLIDNVLGVTVGLASGFVSRKIVIGRSVNVIRNLIGSALQFVVTSVVARNPDSIKTVGQTIFQLFRRKKERTLMNHDNQ
jgi:hypothetical protein